MRDVPLGNDAPFRPGASPSVSVLLPVRNTEAFIRQAVESILNQTFFDLELVVVDDGSTDNTPAILADIASREPRIVVLTQPSAGIVSALELARARARGRYIARMDADDISLPSRLALQVTCLDDNPSIVALGAQVRFMDERGQVGRIGRYPVSPKRCRRYLDYGSPLCHPAVMMRATALAEVGGYSRRFEPAEDFDLWLRLTSLGEIANLKEVLLHYRQHGAATTSARAHANAVATALALVCNRYGETAIDAAQKTTGACDVDWSEIEPHLDRKIQLYARAAYLRGLVLNGGIVREQDFEFFRASLRLMAKDVLVRRTKGILPFMIVRAARQCAAASDKQRAALILREGLRLFPVAVPLEVVTSMLQRGVRALVDGLAKAGFTP